MKISRPAAVIAGSEQRVWKRPATAATVSKEARVRVGAVSGDLTVIAPETRVEASGETGARNRAADRYFAVSGSARVGAEARVRPRAHNNREISRTPTTSA
jgi:hypothetical protein